MEINVLGAGGEVGKSCFLISTENASVMVDCGLHLGRKGSDQLPCFENFGETKPDAVVISHFHLDHIGALPYFTEIMKFDGPIFMTTPTRIMGESVLYDLSKLSAHYTSDDVVNCFSKVTLLQLNETAEVGNMSLTLHYAGHVLGATMIEINMEDKFSVLYTGDFDTSGTRTLGPATPPLNRHWDAVICEGTYCTHTKEDRRSVEQSFLRIVLQAVESGGNVLVPTFGAGRIANFVELLSLDPYFTNSKTKMLFASTVAHNGLFLTSSHSDWSRDGQMLTNQLLDVESMNNLVLEAHLDGEVLPATAFEETELKNSHVMNVTSIQEVKDYASEGPVVLFASPAGLSSGLSCEALQLWASGRDNAVVMTGYCVPGSNGHELILGAKDLTFKDSQGPVEIECRVSYISVTSHADNSGLTRTLKSMSINTLVFVHGMQKQLEQFASEIKTILPDTKIAVPLNGTSVVVAFDESKRKEENVLLENKDLDQIIGLKDALTTRKEKLQECLMKKQLSECKKFLGPWEFEGTVKEEKGSYTMEVRHPK